MWSFGRYYLIVKESLTRDGKIVTGHPPQTGVGPSVFVPPSKWVLDVLNSACRKVAVELTDSLLITRAHIRARVTIRERVAIRVAHAHSLQSRRVFIVIT